jgi:hypothetical protein
MRNLIEYDDFLNESEEFDGEDLHLDEGFFSRLRDMFKVKKEDALDALTKIEKKTGFKKVRDRHTGKSRGEDAAAIVEKRIDAFGSNVLVPSLRAINRVLDKECDWSEVQMNDMAKSRQTPIKFDGQGPKEGERQVWWYLKSKKKSKNGPEYAGIAVLLPDVMRKVQQKGGEYVLEVRVLRIYPEDEDRSVGKGEYRKNIFKDTTLKGLFSDIVGWLPDQVDDLTDADNDF